MSKKWVRYEFYDNRIYRDFLSQYVGEVSRKNFQLILTAPRVFMLERTHEGTDTVVARLLYGG